MTLIEVLAVVCLVALAATLTLAGLGAASADSQLRAALAECRQLDARSRLLARAEGPVMIKVADDRLWAGHSGAVASTPLKMSVLAPGASTFKLVDARGNTIPEVLIDARGCSLDYIIEIRSDKRTDGSPGSRRLRVAGLTGWIEEVAGP